MKKIVLSFDDARLDFYIRAYPLLLKYNMSATLNVTSGFVLSPNKFSFTSANNQPMTIQQVKECFDNGIEIACHGSNHNNTKEDLLQNIAELKEMGIDTNNIGFASPHSHLTIENKNNDGIWDLVDYGTIKYVRSGIQIRREGIIYSVLSVLDRFFHCASLFKILNKKNIIKDIKEPFLPSVTVFSYTTNKQIIELIRTLPDNTAVILMFHSILDKQDAGYGKDKFFWDISWFEDLISFLGKSTEIEVCTTMDLIQA